MTPIKPPDRPDDGLVRYTIGDSHLGPVLLAATTRGVCAVSFAETEGVLIRQLEAQFPAQKIARDDRGLSRWMTELLRVVAGDSGDAELPLDIRGTPFQQRVWKAMRKIPRGETRSYSDVARMLGKPLAARAVARACALNPAMILIPCHRVIARDGTVRGGPTCKMRRERLLEAERASQDGERPNTMSVDRQAAHGLAKREVRH